MKKKIGILGASALILILGFVLVMSKNSYAVTESSGSISLTCNNTSLTAGSTTTCSITGTISGDTVTSLSAMINVSSNLELVSVSTSSIWQGNGDGGNIQLYTDVGKENTFEIGNFVIKAKSGVQSSTESVSIDDVKFYKSDYSELLVNSVSMNITITSSSSTTTPTPSTSPTPSASPSPSPSADPSTPSTGEKSSNNNIKSVTIKWGDGETHTINYEDYDEYDSYIVPYLSVDADISTVEIEAVLEDSKASFVEDYGPRIVNLNYGENDIIIKVEAENGDIKSETIGVTRGDTTATDTETNTTTDKDKNDNAQVVKVANTAATVSKIVIAIGIIAIIVGAAIIIPIVIKKKKEKTNNKKDIDS